MNKFFKGQLWTEQKNQNPLLILAEANGKCTVVSLISVLANELFTLDRVRYSVLPATIGFFDSANLVKYQGTLNESEMAKVDDVIISYLQLTPTANIDLLVDTVMAFVDRLIHKKMALASKVNVDDIVIAVSEKLHDSLEKAGLVTPVTEPSESTPVALIPDLFKLDKQPTLSDFKKAAQFVKQEKVHAQLDAVMPKISGLPGRWDVNTKREFVHDYYEGKLSRTLSAVIASYGIKARTTASNYYARFKAELGIKED